MKLVFNYIILIKQIIILKINKFSNKMFDLNTDSENKKIYSDTNLLKLENCFIYQSNKLILQNVSFKIGKFI